MPQRVMKHEVTRQNATLYFYIHIGFIYDNTITEYRSHFRADIKTFLIHNTK